MTFTVTLIFKELPSFVMERNYDRPFFFFGHNAKEGNRESLNENFPQKTPTVPHDGP